MTDEQKEQVRVDLIDRVNAEENITYFYNDLTTEEEKASTQEIYINVRSLDGTNFSS